MTSAVWFANHQGGFCCCATWFDDWLAAEIGIGLTGFGILFTFLGVLFFFDRGLLAIGNLLFLSGITITIGATATAKFFGRRKNWKGSGFFLAGIFLVLFGWTFVGLCLEGYGFWLLFRGFLPNVLQFIRSIPYAGKILDFPVLKRLMNRVAPKQLPI